MNINQPVNQELVLREPPATFQKPSGRVRAALRDDSHHPDQQLSDLPTAHWKTVTMSRLFAQSALRAAVRDVARQPAMTRFARPTFSHPYLARKITD